GRPGGAVLVLGARLVHHGCGHRGRRRLFGDGPRAGGPGDPEADQRARTGRLTAAAAAVEQTRARSREMRSIAIVGGGQSGLQLALGLLGHGGYEVTVVTDRTPQEVHDGRIMSSQFQFDDALNTERRLGIAFWEDECPKTEAIAFNLAGPDGQVALSWAAKLEEPGMSVDQRVKFPRWMNEVERRGGKLEIRAVGVDELEQLAAAHDLVVVASGKGEIGRLFERDAERSE